MAFLASARHRSPVYGESPRIRPAACGEALAVGLQHHVLVDWVRGELLMLDTRGVHFLGAPKTELRVDRERFITEERRRGGRNSLTEKAIEEIERLEQYLLSRAKSPQSAASPYVENSDCAYDDRRDASSARHTLTRALPRS